MNYCIDKWKDKIVYIGKYHPVDKEKQIYSIPTSISRMRWRK